MVDYVEELEKVQVVCEKYGYRAYLQFNQIHIITKWEAWYFVPDEMGTIKLMHGNSIGQVQRGYHRQFYGRKLSYEQLIIYVHEHECAKYMDDRGEFTFTKTGGVKRAEDEDVIEFLSDCVNDERKTLDEYRDEWLNKYMM